MTAIDAILLNGTRHRKRRDFLGKKIHFPNHDVFVRLVVEELGEYVRAVHDGDDNPTLELIQLGGLIWNALQDIPEEEIQIALNLEEERHPEKDGDNR